LLAGDFRKVSSEEYTGFLFASLAPVKLLFRAVLGEAILDGREISIG
jgi:hypothetical protein